MECHPVFFFFDIMNQMGVLFIWGYLWN